MSEIEVLSKRVEHLEKIIRSMVPKDEQWVGATVITSLTGWNNEDMRRARRNGSVQYKRKKTGSYLYLLSSVPEHLKKAS